MPIHVRSDSQSTRNTNKIKYLQRTGPQSIAVIRTVSHPPAPSIATNYASNSWVRFDCSDYVFTKLASRH